jgi:hypothetical protein
VTGRVRLADHEDRRHHARVEIRALPRLLATTALAILLAAGCSADVEPAPPEPHRPAPAPSGPTSGGGCRVTAGSTGSISSSGASSSTSTINDRTSFSCGGGSTLTIEAIDDSGVTFGAGGAAVTIAPGSAGEAAGYDIEVTRVAGGTAEFQVVPR